MSKGEKMMYTTQEAAAYVGRSVITIKRAVRDKMLIPELHTPRLLVFTKNELDRYKSIQRKAGRPKGTT